MRGLCFVEPSVVTFCGVSWFPCDISTQAGSYFRGVFLSYLFPYRAEGGGKLSLRACALSKSLELARVVFFSYM